MKVWLASLWLVQEWLRFVFLPGLVAIVVGWWAERSSQTGQIEGLANYVPHYLDIENPLYRFGLAAVAIWIALSIVFTATTRLRIRRDNEVRPKR